MTFRRKLLVGMTLLAIGTVAVSIVLLVGSRLVNREQDRADFARAQYDTILNTVVLYQREVRQTEQRLLLTGDNLDITQADLKEIRKQLDGALRTYLQGTLRQDDAAPSDARRLSRETAERMRALVNEFRNLHDQLFKNREQMREMGNLEIEMLFIESDIGHPLAQLIDAVIAEARVRSAAAETSTQTYVRSVARLGIVIPAVILGAVAVFLSVLLRLFGRSMRELRAGTRRIAANELDAPVHLDSLDEFGQLGSEINRTARRLLEAQAERAARFALEEKAAALAAANRELEEFAYIAAHDLTAPLRGISNLAEWIEEDAADRLTIEGRANLTRLRQRVGHMTQMLGDMLSYAVVGQVEATPETVNVAEMLARTVELLSPPAGFGVTYGGMPKFKTVRVPLQEVFTNLINNALKHHDRESGSIEVSSQDKGEFYEFRVADDGPGIARQHHQRVFRMFQRLKRAEEGGGSGLGLALVRRIVEAHGGRVWIESGQGRGARFHFTWPKDASKHKALIPRDSVTQPGSG